MSRNSFNNSTKQQWPIPSPPPPPNQSTPFPKSAIVINSNKWNSITNHLLRGKEEKLATETNNKYKEYSRKESNAMTKTWDNSIEKMREKKITERTEFDSHKLQEGENNFKKLKENDEKIRMERISAAENIIKKLKPGPQNLERAYQFSDVLRHRQIQCELHAESLNREKNQHLLEGKEAIAQAEQECENYKQQLLQKRQQVLQYKKELRDQIDERNMLKQNMEKFNLIEVNEERKKADEDLKYQLNKEKINLKNKKDAQRRNALEAMKMAEERRIRIKMITDMENKVSSVFAEETNNIASIRKDLNNLAVGEKERLRSMIMEKVLTDCTNRQINETNSHAQAVKEYDEKFQKQEQINRELAKRAKEAKIQEHLNEVAQMQRIKENQKLEQQNEIANRLKNNDVNFRYDQECRQHDLKRIQNHRQKILQQIQINHMNKIRRKPTIEADYLEKINQDDDKNFFEFAQELTEEARNKKRPVLPLIRAVEIYKKENRLNAQSEYLPHLQTNINIGLSNTVPVTLLSTLSSTPQRQQQHAAKSTNKIIKYDSAELKKIGSMTTLTRSNIKTITPPTITTITTNATIKTK